MLGKPEAPTAAFPGGRVSGGEAASEAQVAASVLGVRGEGRALP